MKCSERKKCPAIYLKVPENHIGFGVGGLLENRPRTIVAGGIR